MVFYVTHTADILINQQIHLITYNKIQFMTISNFYMFRLRGAIYKQYTSHLPDPSP